MRKAAVLLFNNNASFFSSHQRKLTPVMAADVLGRLVAELVDELGVTYRQRVFTPYMTLYAFLSQVLADDGSCRRAIIEVASILRSRRKKSCSTATGSLCKAKKRLPLALLQAIVRRLGQDLNTGDKEVWAHGRVLVVDGTGFSMPDTKSNGGEFVRHGAGTRKSAQAASNVGFPVGRMVGLFSLATGAVIDLAISTWKGKGSGEISSLNRIWACLKPGDTLLGDALFSAYYVVAKALADGVFIVTELKKTSYWRIKANFENQIIEIDRPRWNSNSSSISQAEHDALPSKIRVRIVKITCAPKGFRPKTKFILTTHLDSKKITNADIAGLYRQRWQVELYFRSIKTTLGMDIVRSKTAEMVVKEVWMHMMAYNLVRGAMSAVAQTRRCLPREISFRATLQALSTWRLLTACNGAAGGQDDLINMLSSGPLVGQRPDRYEPRAIKRRPRGYKLLVHSREVAKTMLHKKSKK